jgi:hypothetical protein
MSHADPGLEHRSHAVNFLLPVDSKGGGGNERQNPAPFATYPQR